MLFSKKKQDKIFKNYLAEVRMKAAVRLLMESDMKTYELAEAVGYRDVRSLQKSLRSILVKVHRGIKKPGGVKICGFLYKVLWCF